MMSNMAMHPAVSRVTPPARNGNRRAARRAGDGPRWTDVAGPNSRRLLCRENGLALRDKLS